MKEITYSKKRIERTPTALRQLTRDDLFVDIETTGLSSKRNKIYLIGLGKFNIEDSTISVRQLFAEEEKEEEAILKAFQKELEGTASIITFNGNRFDLPFLRDRLQAFGLDPGPLERILKKDLYLDFKPAKKYYNLPSLRQKSIEAFLGIQREDEKSGKELIPIYHAYERTRSSDLSELLLLHNKDDVLGMVPLFLMYDYIGFLGQSPDRQVSTEEQLLKNKLSKIHLSIEKVQPDIKNSLVFFGTTDLILPSEVRYREDCLLLSLDQGKVKGVLLPERQDLYFTLPDYKNYYYLPEEGRILPKVLAVSLPRDRYRKARKEDCMERSHGLFLPLLPGINIDPSANQRIYFKKEEPKKKFIRLPDQENEAEQIRIIEKYLNLYLLSRFQ